MNQLIDALSTQGYFVWDDFLTQEEVVALRDCIPENWKKARIGRNDEVTRESTIRSDKIQWVRRDMGQPASLFLDKMEQIRLAANQAFFLGLFEYEAHFAKYEKGDFYQKHLDCFKGNENRRLTTVFYMNDEWTEEDAGAFQWLTWILCVNSMGKNKNLGLLQLVSTGERRLEIKSFRTFRF